MSIFQMNCFNNFDVGLLWLGEVRFIIAIEIDIGSKAIGEV